MIVNQTSGIRRCWMLFLALVLALPVAVSYAADEPNFTRQEDVIYGRKFGVALTLDVFKPKENANGLAVISVMSGGWFSSHDNINAHTGNQLLQRGYTVFAVVHGSQPKFTIPEIVQDMNRAVRFIRYHAKDYGIDPDHIGITGGSAGGHLSLMQGNAGDLGDPKAKDPVDQTSSRVQAVACFFPPTDFLNYGEAGKDAIGRNTLVNYAAPFDFREFDPKLKKFVSITDEEKLREIAKKISPIYHVSADSPPTLIIHGDKDTLVPMQQSQMMVEKLKAAGVEAKLVVKEGAQHGWKDMGPDQALIVDWFDQHLKPKEAAKEK